MFIATRNGTISTAKRLSETPKMWALSLVGESRIVQVSKTDQFQRAFELKSDALCWANADRNLIQCYLDQEETELAKSIELPEVTLAQLGLDTLGFELPFKPLYCAMEDGIDRPGGCWYLFEDRPSFDSRLRLWNNEGDAWEIGLDDSENLTDTPEFQRWVKPALSLCRIVDVATEAPRYHHLAYVPESSRKAYLQPLEHPNDTHIRTDREKDAAKEACVAFAEYWLPARLRNAFRSPAENEAFELIALGCEVHDAPDAWGLDATAAIAAKRAYLFLLSNKRYRLLTSNYSTALTEAMNAEWEIEEIARKHAEDIHDTYQHIEADLNRGWAEECRDLGMI
jgi:hypothetical protein